MPRAVVWTSDDRAWLEAQLSLANGRRTARRLELDAVMAAVERTARTDAPYLELHGGDVQDARQFTTLCLCVSTPLGVVVGVGASRTGPASPARVFTELPSWDFWTPSANELACVRWAERRAVDRRCIAFEPTRASLLDAIRASPDDDGPRLVYADHLMEQGDPRGAFIAMQCALAKADDGRLLDESSALLAANRDAWLEGLSPNVANVLFRRGLVDEVAVFDVAAVNAAQAVLSRELVRRLFFVATGSVDLVAVLRWEWLSELHVLSFRAPRYAISQLRPERLAMLLGTRRLRGLRELELNAQNLGDEGAELLAASDTFPALQAFTFSNDRLSSVGLEALSGAGWFTRLEKLVLMHHELGPDAGQVLAATRFKRLRSLVVSSNRLGDEGAVALAQSPHLARLESLWLTSNRIGVTGVEALLASRALSKTQLVLDSNQLSDKVMERISARNAALAP